MEYSIINTKTNELYQSEATPARFGTFYQARLISVTLNDQSKIRHGFHSGTGDGWTETCNDWQVIEAPETFSTISKQVNKHISCGIYEAITEIRFFAKGEHKSITRAPRISSSKTSNIELEIHTLQSSIALKKEQLQRLESLVQAIEANITEELNEQKVILMQRRISHQMEINKIKSSLTSEQRSLFELIGKRRAAQNKTSTTKTPTASSPCIVRRKAS